MSIESTEDDVRAAVKTLIEGIAVSKLGFSVVGGNVKDYPIEFAQDEELTAYLYSTIGADKVLRAFYVWVETVDETPKATNLVLDRVYNIRVGGYFPKGQDGVPAKLAIQHARAIREAIWNTGTITLSNTVDRIEMASAFSLSPLTLETDGADEDIFNWEMRFDAYGTAQPTAGW